MFPQRLLDTAQLRLWEKNVSCLFPHGGTRRFQLEQGEGKGKKKKYAGTEHLQTGTSVREWTPCAWSVGIVPFTTKPFGLSLGFT